MIGLLTIDRVYKVRSTEIFETSALRFENGVNGSILSDSLIRIASTGTG
jgi:hypothetical protein